MTLNRTESFKLISANVLGFCCLNQKSDPHYYYEEAEPEQNCEVLICTSTSSTTLMDTLI